MDQAQIQHKIDTKTKPVGSLGQLEQLAQQICLLQDSLTPSINQPTVLVFAADHGLANEGVSPYPQDVTWQMVMNFIAGGAAINVFSQQNGLDLKVIDAGVNYNFPPATDLIDRKIAMGTASALHSEAMTASQCEQALAQGRDIVKYLQKKGTNLICLGEMGIGNTSSAALIMSKIMAIPLEDCIGRGAGSNDEQIKKKSAVLTQVLNHHSEANSSMEILQAMGGFEIAMMVGAVMEAASRNMLVIVDGFITTASVLIAQAMGTNIQKNCIFSHCSNEQGHQKMLDHLGGKPLLNLGLRLGEGTGAALAYPLVQAAVNFINNMASFESAGVSDKDK